MKKVILDLIEEIEKEVDRSSDENQKQIYNKILEACIIAKTEARKLEDDNKEGKYVMVIEDYIDEDYMYGVRFKSSILDYKKIYWGYTDELNEEELAKMIHNSFYAKWYAIIDLSIMEFLSKDTENIIYSKWKDKISEPDEEFFFNNFHYNEEEQYDKTKRYVLVTDTQPKEYNFNYTKAYSAYTDPMDVVEICDAITFKEYLTWFKVIDLEEKRFLTEDEEKNLMNEYHPEFSVTWVSEDSKLVKEFKNKFHYNSSIVD